MHCMYSSSAACHLHQLNTCQMNFIMFVSELVESTDTLSEELVMGNFIYPLQGVTVSAKNDERHFSLSSA